MLFHRTFNNLTLFQYIFDKFRILYKVIIVCMYQLCFIRNSPGLVRGIINRFVSSWKTMAWQNTQVKVCTENGSPFKVHSIIRCYPVCQNIWLQVNYAREKLPEIRYRLHETIWLHCFDIYTLILRWYGTLM